MPKLSLIKLKRHLCTNKLCMRRIEMVDLKGQYLKIKKEVDERIADVIASAAFVKGAGVELFCRNMEQFLGVKHVIPCGNGTDALQISMMALGLKPGDEIIVPSFTFIATAEAAALLGLKPVFCDVDEETFCISADKVEALITERTKAIVPVHLFGQNADMDAIMKLAEKHGLFVIEDACQSVSARYRFADGREGVSGCMGHVGCTSFFPSKNLGCFGDGGAMFTNDDDLAKTLRSVANHGMEVRYHHDRVGVNSRLDGIQAAVLDVKLRYLDDYTRARQRAAEFYDSAFRDVEQIKCPVRSADSAHVFHQYTIQTERRDDLKAFLAERGIPSMVYYPIPLHLQKAFAGSGFKVGDCPVSERLAKRVLSLPMHTELDEEQLEFIVSNVKDFFA